MFVKEVVTIRHQQLVLQHDILQQDTKSCSILIFTLLMLFLHKRIKSEGLPYRKSPP